MREFVDEGDGEHECTAEFVGLGRGWESVRVEDAEEAGRDVEQGVCAAEVEG